MKRLIMFLLITFSATSALAGSELVVDVKLTPAGSFQAVTEEIQGDIFKKEEKVISKKITIPINSLKTGIDLRDEHLWKHVNYSKHQFAILTELIGQNGHATAMLEVAGIKRPIKISYQEKKDQLIGQFKISASEFKLPRAEYLGIGVEDEVVAEVTMPFKKL